VIVVFVLDKFLLEYVLATSSLKLLKQLTAYLFVFLDLPFGQLRGLLSADLLS